MAKRKAKLSGAALGRRRAELTALIERDLTALAPDAIRTLAAIAKKSPPARAQELMFEVFEVGPCLEVVYRVLGPNGFNDQLAFGQIFDQEALASVSQFDDADMAIEIEWRLVRDAFFRLFPLWWTAAGGAQYPKPVMLSEHDMLEEHPLAWRNVAGEGHRR